MENDYPELSGDFALRGASNSRLCASDGTGPVAGADGSNGNVLQNSQVRMASLSTYRAGLSIGRKVWKIMFWDVPPSCLGSR